mgnify:FL=1
MMAAFGKGERTIDLDHVRRAAEDTEGVAVPVASYKPMLVAGVAAIAGSALLFYLVSYYL